MIRLHEKKQNILNTAISMFVQRGFHETTMADIARSCNISKSTLYKFFESKEDFYAQALFQMLDVLISELEAVDKDSTLNSQEKLYQKLLLNIRFMQNNMTFHSHANLKEIDIRHQRILDLLMVN